MDFKVSTGKFSPSFKSDRFSMNSLSVIFLRMSWYIINTKLCQWNSCFSVERIGLDMVHFVDNIYLHVHTCMTLYVLCLCILSIRVQYMSRVIMLCPIWYMENQSTLHNNCWHNCHQKKTTFAFASLYFSWYDTRQIISQKTFPPK